MLAPDDIRKEIVRLVSLDNTLDGVDIATRIGIPIDVAYREIQILIDADIINRIYFGIQSRLELVED